MNAEIDLPETTRQLIPVLRLIHYLLIHRPNALLLSGSAVFVRLIGIFLCPPEVSHNKTIVSLLQPLLEHSVSRTTAIQNVNIPIRNRLY